MAGKANMGAFVVYKVQKNIQAFFFKTTNLVSSVPVGGG